MDRMRPFKVKRYWAKTRRRCHTLLLPHLFTSLQAPATHTTTNRTGHTTRYTQSNNNIFDICPLQKIKKTYIPEVRPSCMVRPKIVRSLSPFSSYVTRSILAFRTYNQKIWQRNERLNHRKVRYRS